VTRPRIVSVMNDETYDLVMSPQAEAKLARFTDFDRHRGASNLDEDGLIRALRGADGALASWGVRWTERAIRETDLKIIGHAAGTVRGLPMLVWERGIAVTHAAPVIAVAVGEMALTLTLACLRHLTEHDGAFKEQGTRGRWAGFGRRSRSRIV
jgi:phosphoglycerate dehydrogenase-like enzyme